MSFKRALCVSSLAAGIGITGLFGVGLGTANADPWQGCGHPGAPQCDDHRDDHRDAALRRSAFIGQSTLFVVQ